MCGVERCAETVCTRGNVQVAACTGWGGEGMGKMDPGDLPDPEIEPASLTSPALAGSFFTTIATWEAARRSHG